MTYNNGFYTIAKESNYCKGFTLAVIMAPILRQYVSGIPGVTLADIVLGITCIYLLLKSQFIVSLQKVYPLILFWFFGITVSLISLLIQQTINFEIITRIIRYSFYVFLVIVSSTYFQLNYGVKIFKHLSRLISTYIILQAFLYNLFGVLLPFKILPFELLRDIEGLGSIASYYLRPSGIFVEPGYAAQFLLPGLALSLFGWLEGSKIDIKNAILIISALVLTTSSQAIFIGMITLGVFLIMRLKSIEDYSRIVKNFIMIVIFFILIMVAFNLDNVQVALTKITGEIRAGSSTALRLYRGLAVFAQLPILYKFMGVGHGNLGNFVIENSIITRYDPMIITPAIADYVNGMSEALLYYGVIGFLLLCYVYWQFLRNTKQAFKLITIIHIVLIFVGGGVTNIMIVFYFSFIYAGYNFEFIKKAED